MKASHTTRLGHLTSLHAHAHAACPCSRRPSLYCRPPFTSAGRSRRAVSWLPRPQGGALPARHVPTLRRLISLLSFSASSSLYRGCCPLCPPACDLFFFFFAGSDRHRLCSLVPHALVRTALAIIQRPIGALWVRHADTYTFRRTLVGRGSVPCADTAPDRRFRSWCNSARVGVSKARSSVTLVTPRGEPSGLRLVRRIRLGNG